MANEVYTRTNQALFFARKALDAWREAEGSQAFDARTQALYHREHVLFHLYRTVLATVHEVADRYRWPLLELRTVEQALDGEAAKRFPGPELAELSELAREQDTWLSRMLAGWLALHAPPVHAASKPEDASLIASSAVTARAEWSLADADDAVGALNELVSRYRDGMVEY
ncbi:MAG: DUF6586 family protein [Pseudomonas profundi]|uniref:DUF6586 family protein n=1 Tax=Pseudomonas profundi TaxID=1981513 RepID=UPI003001F9CF